MLSCMNAWVPLGLLSPFLLAVGAVVCSEKETLLKPMPSSVTQPTDCLMECSAMTYIKKLQLQDNKNIRLKDSTEGELGEYCWSTELQCTIGESFHSAYAVLPVDLSAGGHEQLEVRAADPGAGAGALDAHSGPTALADGCGLRYDVTQHFGSRAAGALFCIRVGVQEDKLLKCPPYLVTFWQRTQADQQGGG